MGIRGAYSLLQSEPSRFGKPWTISSLAGKDVHIFIDAPALHHHLVSAWIDEIKQEYTPLDCTSHTRHRPKLPVDAPRWPRDLQYSSPTPCSTTVLYKLTFSFLQTLFLAGAQEVHVVWDGVASPFKRQAQIKRLETQCHQSYQNAQRFTTNSLLGSTHEIMINHFVSECPHRLHPTCHLWGEFIMQEAIYDLQETLERDGARKGILWNHSADNEADIYMGHFLHHLKKETTPCDCVVLSNDSDLLVYNSIPGFIPLSTLIFEITTSLPTNTSSATHTHYSVNGWMYTHQQFIYAFPYLHSPSTENTKVVLHSDSSPYTSTPTSTSTAEVRDDTVCSYPMLIIAALAGCDYTLDPTLEQSLNEVRNALVKSDVGGLRLRDRNDPSSKKTLTAIIRCIGHIIKMVPIGRSLRVNESMTILGTAIVDYYVRKNHQKKAPRNLNKRTAGLNDGHNLGRDVVDVTKNLFIQALIEISGIYHEASCSTKPVRNRKDQKVSLDTNLRRILDHRVFYCKPLIELHDSPHSIWMDPIFSTCRARLYAVFAFICKQQSKEYCSVVEYVHVRRGSRDFYCNFSHHFADMTAFLESKAGEPLPVTDLLGFIIGSSTPTLLQDSTKSIPMFATFLLNSCKAKLLLFATTFISTIFTDHWQRMVILNPQDFSQSINDKTIYLDLYNHLHVALFHVKTAFGMIALLSCESDQCKLCVNRFLLDEVLIWTLWRRIEVEQSHSHKWDFYESSRECLLQIISTTVNSPVDCDIHMKCCEMWKLWFE
jgi:hypothetical protein